MKLLLCTAIAGLLTCAASAGVQPLSTGSGVTTPSMVEEVQYHRSYHPRHAWRGDRRRHWRRYDYYRRDRGWGTGAGTVLGLGLLAPQDPYYYDGYYYARRSYPQGPYCPYGTLPGHLSHC